MKKKQSSTEVIGVRLSKAERRKVERTARAEGRSMSSLIRQAINQYVSIGSR